MPQAFKTTKKERGHFANHSFGKKKQNNNNKKTIKTHHHSKVKYSDNIEDIIEVVPDFFLC